MKRKWNVPFFWQTGNKMEGIFRSTHWNGKLNGMFVFITFPFPFHWEKRKTAFIPFFSFCPGLLEWKRNGRGIFLDFMFLISPDKATNFFPGGCEHRCVNSPGGFRCECPPDKQLSSNGRSCVEKNTCSVENGGCEHGCEERDGKFYRCRCRSGYLLDEIDKRSCHRESWLNLLRNLKSLIDIV